MTMPRVPKDQAIDPFEDFDRMFDEMRRRMEEMMRSTDEHWHIGSISMQAETKTPELPTKHSGPSVHDGEYRMIEEAEEEEESGLLVDVVERGSSVLVMMEMPGISSEDVYATLKGKKLHLDIDAKDGRVVRSVDLPCSVKPSTLKVNCRNGVLVAEMDRQPARKPRKRVKDPSLV
jgi:HSP20 family molecular chaperone IbpA